MGFLTFEEEKDLVLLTRKSIEKFGATFDYENKNWKNLQGAIEKGRNDKNKKALANAFMAAAEHFYQKFKHLRRQERLDVDSDKVRGVLVASLNVLGTFIDSVIEETKPQNTKL